MKKIKSVLLIDNDEINNFINLRLLTRYGITDNVTVLVNGLEALQFFQYCQQGVYSIPELILLDVKMPVLDGFEFLDKLMEMPIDIKRMGIIILSSGLKEADRKRIETYPIKGVIEKPLAFEKLESILVKKKEVIREDVKTSI